MKPCISYAAKVILTLALLLALISGLSHHSHSISDLSHKSEHCQACLVFESIASKAGVAFYNFTAALTFITLFGFYSYREIFFSVSNYYFRSTLDPPNRR